MIPEKLKQWAEQPEARVSGAEFNFMVAVSDAATKGVGFGFMQQVIEWMWQEWAERNGLPGSAWGPEYFNAQIAELEARIAKLTCS